MNLMSRGCVLQKDLVAKNNFSHFLYQMLALENQIKETRIIISIKHPTEEGRVIFFDDYWRGGKEIRKIIITRRFYQVSRYETKS